MILEYFYIEKYISKTDVWYFIPHNIILALVYLKTTYDGIECIRIYYSSQANTRLTHRIGINGIMMLSAGVSQFFRCIGVIYYYVKNDLDPRCFSVDIDIIKGKTVLIQTPFNCLISIDYVILITTAIFYAAFSLQILLELCQTILAFRCGFYYQIGGNPKQGHWFQWRLPSQLNDDMEQLLGSTESEDDVCYDSNDENQRPKEYVIYETAL